MAFEESPVKLLHCIGGSCHGLMTEIDGDVTGARVFAMLPDDGPRPTEKEMLAKSKELYRLVSIGFVEGEPVEFLSAIDLTPQEAMGLMLSDVIALRRFQTSLTEGD